MSEETHTPRPHLTNEEREDLTVLSACDADGMLRAPVAWPPEHVANAMRRCHLNEWLRLIDMEPHEAVQGAMRRVFKLTDAGWARFNELRKKVEQ